MRPLECGVYTYIRWVPICPNLPGTNTKRSSNLKLCSVKKQIVTPCSLFRDHNTFDRWQLAITKLFLKVQRSHTRSLMSLGTCSTPGMALSDSRNFSCSLEICMSSRYAKSLCQVYQFNNVKSLHPSLLDPRLDNTSNSKTASDYVRVHFVCSCIKMSRSSRSYQNYRISSMIRKEAGKVAAVLWVELATSPPGVMGKDKQKENGNEWTSNLLPLQKHLWPCSTMFPIALPAISKNIFIYQGLIMHGQCILSIVHVQPYF